MNALQEAQNLLEQMDAHRQAFLGELHLLYSSTCLFFFFSLVFSSLRPCAGFASSAPSPVTCFVLRDVHRSSAGAILTRHPRVRARCKTCRHFFLCLAEDSDVVEHEDVQLVSQMHALEDRLDQLDEVPPAAIDSSKLAEFQSVLQNAKQLHEAERQRFAERQERKRQRAQNQLEAERRKSQDPHSIHPWGLLPGVLFFFAFFSLCIFMVPRGGVPGGVWRWNPYS